MTYDDAIESVRDRYDARVRELLESIARACGHYGHRADRDEVGSVVSAWGDDEYVWSLTVRHADAPPPEQMTLPGVEKAPSYILGVDVTLVEERAREGGDGWGVTFNIIATTEGGREIFQVAPRNYTERWVVDARDEEAVEARWEELEGAVVAGEIAERFEESSRGVDP